MGNTHEFIVDTVRALVGIEYLYFDDAVSIDQEGASCFPCFIWAICIDQKDNIYLMDSDEQWHALEPADADYQAMIDALTVPLKRELLKYQKTA